MPYRILNHTWSIRTVSSFAVPLQVSPLSDPSTLDQIGKDIAGVVRVKRSTSRNESESSEVSVVVSWIICDEHDNSESSVNSFDRRVLNIEVAIGDNESAAHVLLCGPEFSQNEESMTKCSYALVRGVRHGFEAVLEWIESTCWCVFGIFRPCPNQVARALSQWTYQQVKQTSSAQKTTEKPFEVTFSVPVQDLSQLTLTIPRVALARLCRDMEAQRPGNRKRTRDESCQDKDEDFPDKEELPILKALQHYVQETYNIDLQHCSLIRASSSIAALGCDGRVKPLDAGLLMVILQEIDVSIHEQIPKLGDGEPAGDCNGAEKG